MLGFIFIFFIIHLMSINTLMVGGSFILRDEPDWYISIALMLLVWGSHSRNYLWYKQIKGRSHPFLRGLLFWSLKVGHSGYFEVLLAINSFIYTDAIFGWCIHRLLDMLDIDSRWFLVCCFEATALAHLDVFLKPDVGQTWEIVSLVSYFNTLLL